MKHLKLFENFTNESIYPSKFFCGSDYDIGYKILKLMDDLDSEEISNPVYYKYNFNIRGSEHTKDDYPQVFSVEVIDKEKFLDNWYEIKVDGVDMDISSRICKKIFNKAKSILLNKEKMDKNIKKSEIRDML
jgi:hypothetical protein